VAEPEPAPRARGAGSRAAPGATPAPVAPPPSLLDRVFGAARQPVAVAGAGAALIVAAVAVFLRKRKDEGALHRGRPRGNRHLGRCPTHRQAEGGRRGWGRCHRAAGPAREPDAILVEETAPPSARAAPARPVPMPVPPPAPEAAGGWRRTRTTSIPSRTRSPARPASTSTSRIRWRSRLPHGLRPVRPGRGNHQEGRRARARPLRPAQQADRYLLRLGQCG
jgi:hypothetical protein